MCSSALCCNTYMDVEFRIMKVRIDGLTEHQSLLLDCIWEKDSAQEFYDWIDSLTGHNLREVLTLTDMIQLAYIDTEVTCTTDMTDVYNAIMACRAK